MLVEEVVIREIEIPLREPFRTALGEERSRRLIIVEAHAGDVVGYGEASPLSFPNYNEETAQTVVHVLNDFLIPALFAHPWEHPDEVHHILAPVRRHYMAKAGLEGAVWDLWAKAKRLPLYAALGGRRRPIPSGIAIGLETETKTLIDRVARALQEGYHRIKIKVKPGWDVVPVRALRRELGPFPLMVDANSAYTLDDTDPLRALDEYNLLMIEQPLAADDIIDHAKLQRSLSTPICLDESIHSAADARRALELGSCRVINIKAGRVGGLSEARRIHDLCEAHGIPVWCGGLLQSGIGRAHNLALASLPNFSIPGDLSPSHRYFDRDIISPALTMDAEGAFSLPDEPGIGFEVDTDLLNRYTVRQKRLTSPSGKGML